MNSPFRVESTDQTQEEAEEFGRVEVEVEADVAGRVETGRRCGLLETDQIRTVLSLEPETKNSPDSPTKERHFTFLL